MHKKQITSEYIRNFTFGVEDSLASTVGLLSGVASAEVNRSTIILTGIILVFTEALSMGVGSFLSEESAEEYEHKPKSGGTPAKAALLMFFSYAIAGIIPISPYVFSSMPVALWLSIAFSLIGLLALGLFNGLISKGSILRHGRRMLILGGSVAIAGLVIGTWLKTYK